MEVLLAMFGSVGYPELILFGVVAILLFGKRLPEVARSLGGTYRDFRKSLNEIKTSFSVVNQTVVSVLWPGKIMTPFID